MGIFNAGIPEGVDQFDMGLGMGKVGQDSARIKKPAILLLRIEHVVAIDKDGNTALLPRASHNYSLLPFIVNSLSAWLSLH